MDKYSVETGLNKDGMPVIKCSTEYYEELIQECRSMVRYSIEMGTFKMFARTYPGICVLANMPTISELFNSN